MQLSSKLKVKEENERNLHLVLFKKIALETDIFRSKMKCKPEYNN